MTTDVDRTAAPTSRKADQAAPYVSKRTGCDVLKTHPQAFDRFVVAGRIRKSQLPGCHARFNLRDIEAIATEAQGGA